MFVEPDGAPQAMGRETLEKLWDSIGKAITRVCKEATKPRRPVHAPMHIEAGTPL